MRFLDLFRKREKRSMTYTDLYLGARFEAITGIRGVGELTGTVQACVGLWESGLSLADVDGTDVLTPRTLALMARSLGLGGEAVFLMAGNRLLPAAQWDISTRGGIPAAYRLTMPDINGGQSFTVLAGEVLHVAIGAQANAPWQGQAPLKRASLTAGWLQALETSLSEVYELAPIGSQITPMPENPEVDNEALARSFRGQRGRVLLRESVNVTAAGGPAPMADWKPSGLSPDLSKSLLDESLQAARQSILSVYGVLPSLFDPSAAGPSVREGQRHLAQWMLQPIANLIAQEASEKLGSDVTLDVMRPTQSYDAGNRARALKATVEALALAKQAGLSDEAMAAIGRFAGTEP